MNKKQLHEQSLKELRKLEYIFEEESSARPVATSVKNHLESLGYETKRTMAEVGDLTPEFGDTLKDVGSAFKQKLPDLKIKFGSGRDLFHKQYPNSRHNKGNAIDVVFKGIEKGDKDELDKISTLLCALRKKYPGFTFIDEYRRPSRFSTGVHYHLSYSDSKTDEGGGTAQFCSSLKNLDNLEDIDFEKIESAQTTQEPSKLEKFLDSIGLGSLTGAKYGDKESQKELVSKVQDKKDVKDTGDGFEIFGYKVDDIIDKIGDILPQFESYEDKDRKKLNEEVINELKKMKYIFEKNSKVLDNFSGDIENGPKYHGSRPLGNWQSDNAWDLFAPAGTQWDSITKGTVTKVYNTGRSTGKIYGTQVSIEGTDEYPNIFYTHLKDVTVKKGDTVNIGTPIGKVSEWGKSKSTHVHVGLPYGKHIDDLLTPDFSDPSGEPSTFEVVKNEKKPSKLDSFLDSVGLGSLTGAKAGDKESQKELVSKVEDKKDVKDTNDGFEIFGYSVDDILDKIGDLLPQFESEQKRKNILETLEIRDISGMSTYGRKNEKLKSRDFFVIHHTAGRGDAEKVVGILNSRKGGLGVQWVIERDGSIVRTLPSGSRGAHTLNSSDFPSAPQGINNSNAEGVEVIGMNDEDILPVQAVSALKLVKSLGYSPDSIYGHGEINPGHKAKTEGQTIKQFILKNWGNSESDYDYSMFENRGIDVEAETKNIKEPSKLDSFLDAVGLGSLTGAKSGDKESQKELVSKVENEKDVKDTGDGFEIFGYKVDDILDKLGDLLPQFESEQEKKNLLEDIERIKSKMIK